jgi:hypothetical protein
MYKTVDCLAGNGARLPLLGMFVNLRNATINFVISAGLSVWNNSSPTEIFFFVKYVI